MWGRARPSVLVAQRVKRQLVQVRVVAVLVARQRVHVRAVRAEIGVARQQVREVAIGVAVLVARQRMQQLAQRQAGQQQPLRPHRSHQSQRANHPRRRLHQLAPQFLTMCQRQALEFQCPPCQSRSLPAAHQPKSHHQRT
jgi:hypothetical protein